MLLIPSAQACKPLAPILVDIITKYNGRQNLQEIVDEVNKTNQEFRLTAKIDRIIYIKRVDNLLRVYSLFFKAKGTIDDSKNQIIFKVSFRLPMKVVGIVIPLFLLSFLFAPNVTINDNNSPTFMDRATFTLAGLGLFTIPYLIFFGLKKDFTKNLIGLLNKTGANRRP